MNKVYKSVYKEGIGWVAISEEASSVSSSRGSGVVSSGSNGGLLDKFI